MTKRSTSAEGTQAELSQSGDEEPTPKQLASFRLARICLLELEALYTDMLEEDRHNWVLYPERKEWLEDEVVRLRDQRRALTVGELDANVQIVRQYRMIVGRIDACDEGQAEK